MTVVTFAWIGFRSILSYNVRTRAIGSYFRLVWPKSSRPRGILYAYLAIKELRYLGQIAPPTLSSRQPWTGKPGVNPCMHDFRQRVDNFFPIRSNQSDIRWRNSSCRRRQLLCQLGHRSPMKAVKFLTEFLTGISQWNFSPKSYGFSEILQFLTSIGVIACEPKTAFQLNCYYTHTRRF